MIYKWAIFHSYIKLPDGNMVTSHPYDKTGK